ncbi:MAG TPA: hypothetical protein DIU15_05025 [Deltaproteobacteria bacterium]|nr:hypothetical protein [Deltaproteobacteria bacterium]HCP45379.1 hypothetical protein [Deltaproteobacteria bacterium]
MRLRLLSTALVLLTLGGLLASCDISYHQYVGRVYDGASGDRIDGYTIFAEFWKTSIEGTVDEETGRYTLGKVPEDTDFTIMIDKNGYRSFMAHTAMFQGGDCDDCPDETKTYYYDAYLYPEGLPSPAVTFDITLRQTDAEAAGLIRLVPAAGGGTPSLYGAQPVGVDDGDNGRQIWVNDEDLQFRAVTKAFAGGIVTFEEGELVYGVNYDVIVFDVDGYDDFTTSYRAGEGHQAWQLDPAASDPLALTFHSNELGLWDEDGTLVMIFNQPIEFLAEDREEYYEEQLDDGLSIDSPDVDGDPDEDWPDDGDCAPGTDPCGDGDSNVLNGDDPDEDDEDDRQENGTDMDIDGNRLELQWDGELSDSDSGDPINSVTYCNLGDIELHATRGPASNNLTLADALGADAPGGCITVDMLP